MKNILTLVPYHQDGMIAEAKNDIHSCARVAFCCMDNIGMSAFTLKTILLLEVLEYLVSNYLASTCFMFGDVIEANNAE